MPIVTSPRIITAQTTDLPTDDLSKEITGVIARTTPYASGDVTTYHGVPDALIPHLENVYDFAGYTRVQIFDALQRLHQAPRYFTHVLLASDVDHSSGAHYNTYAGNILGQLFGTKNGNHSGFAYSWDDLANESVAQACRALNLSTYSSFPTIAIAEPRLICTATDLATIAELAKTHKRLIMRRIPREFQETDTLFIHKKKELGGLKVIGYSKNWKSRRSKVKHTSLARQYAAGVIDLCEPLQALREALPVTETLSTGYIPLGRNPFGPGYSSCAHGYRAHEVTCPDIYQFIEWFLSVFDRLNPNQGPDNHYRRGHNHNYRPDAPPQTWANPPRDRFITQRAKTPASFLVGNCPHEVDTLITFIRRYWRFFMFHMSHATRTTGRRNSSILNRPFLVTFSRLCRMMGYARLPPVEEFPGTEDFPSVSRVWAESPRPYRLVE